MRRIIEYFFVGLLLWFTPSIYYNFCGERVVEQEWLDQVITHLATLSSNDPEVQAVLNHAVTRYNQIGPFDVMVLPLLNPGIGVNVPFSPGLVLDPVVMDLPIHIGALILAHEAGHDFYPYLHPFVDPLMNKIEALPCPVH